MLHLYLIRHGETDANVAQALKVSFTPATLHESGLPTNVPLNETGKEQVRICASKLPNIDAIFSSPLLRVIETAEIICNEKGINHTDIQLRDELKEYEKGTVEGLPFDEMTPILGQDMWEAARNCNYDYTSVGGDSWKTIYDRIESLLKELKQNYDGKTVVCVTSGGVIRMFYKFIFKDTNPTISRHLAIKNASVHEFLI